MGLFDENLNNDYSGGIVHNTIVPRFNVGGMGIETLPQVGSISTNNEEMVSVNPQQQATSSFITDPNISMNHSSFIGQPEQSQSLSLSAAEPMQPVDNNQFILQSYLESISPSVTTENQAFVSSPISESGSVQPIDTRNEVQENETLSEEITLNNNIVMPEKSVNSVSESVQLVNDNVTSASSIEVKNLGKVVAVHDNVITVNLMEDIVKLPNLVNTHVIFEYKDERVVGEVVETETTNIKINVIGEIINGNFVTGLNRKPDYNSIIRPVNQPEITLILGDQELNSMEEIRLGSSTVYKNYKINVGINAFFSNHFSIIGNTGSGKSSTLARLVQNIFTSSDYLPVNVNIFLFDAYGEYNTAFGEINKINPMLNYKSYTTNTIYPDTEILKIPLWLLDVDDIALLLGANEPAQLPIIEKTLKLVPILKGIGEQVEAYKNDIITRAILDILKSGKEAAKVRDQITAVLTTFHTDAINLEATIKQPGYNRTLRQCIYVDNSGKLQEMELLVSYLSAFIIDDFTLPSPKGDVLYTLNDLNDALEFALISEGILKSDKIFDYANILSVRLRSLAGSESAKFFEYDKLITRNGYISNLLTTLDGKKAQIVNFNINYVDDRLAKTITKIISKLLFGFSADNKDRGSIPIHIIIEEAHRYVQNDIDTALLGYNIFERITKEGRKYGMILGLITQRPSELSETCISQCSNFIILRTQHPKDLNYIKQMVPNFSEELASVLRVLQPGNAIAFGSAFKVPVAVKIEKPNPEPYSRSSDIAKIWYAQK